MESLFISLKTLLVPKGSEGEEEEEEEESALLILLFLGAFARSMAADTSGSTAWFSLFRLVSELGSRSV